MEKKAVVLVVILGASIVFNILCLLGGPSNRQLHEAFCANTFDSCVYIGNGLSFLFMLLLTGLFFLLNPVFSLQRFVSSLFKPPQAFSY